MEYAAGGELFARICSAGRFSEDEVVLTFYEKMIILHTVQIECPILSVYWSFTHLPNHFCCRQDFFSNN